jgi:hypothetical protein
MTAPGPDWVEQARRFVISSGLVEALSAGRPAAHGAHPGPAAASPGDDRSADHPAECRWCPLCTGLAALRGRRPDLVEGLADLLGTAAVVLRAHAAGAATAADPARPAPADATPEETVTPPPPPVQRIDVA